MTTSRRVLVTGGSSGMGLATALRFAETGARVALLSRSPEALDTARRRCLDAGAVEVVTVVADVRDAGAVDAAVDGAVARWGGLDVVVHAAAVMAYGALTELEPEVFETVVRTIVEGTVTVARVVLPVLRSQRSGVLVVVNSVVGSVTVPMMGAYAVGKWGQRAVVRTLQQETRDVPGVRVCLVSPGSVNTPIYYRAANGIGREVRPPGPAMSPERVARRIVSLADRPRRHVSFRVGFGNPVITAGYRLFPRLFDLLVAPLFRLLGTVGPAPRSDGAVHAPDPSSERVHGRWPDRAG